MAFTNDEKQEIKTIVQEVIGEQSDPIDDTTQVDALQEGDIVAIVRAVGGVNSYRKAPVGLFGGGGGGGTIIVDSALSTTSTHPVMNKVVTAALNSRQATLISSGSGQNIKTVNGQSLLGTGDIPVSGAGTVPVITATATVDAMTGIPSVSVVKTGTDAAPNFAFAFTGLKGESGGGGGGGGGGQSGTKVYLEQNGGTLPELSSTNVVYVISYNYTISGSATVPAGCAFEFAGGSIDGGTLVLNNTYLYGNIKFGTSITVSGTCKNATAYQKWFSGNNVDAWHRFINNVDGPSCYEYEFGEYAATVKVLKQLDNKSSITLNGNNATVKFTFDADSDKDNYTILKAFVFEPKDSEQSVSSQINGSYPVSRGDTQITVSSASGFNVGDVISIRNNTDYSFSPFRASYKHCEFATIREISENTLKLAHPVYGEYKGSSCMVYTMRNISCHINDLVVGLSNPTAVNTPCFGIAIYQSVGGGLRNVKVSDYRYNIMIYSSMDMLVEGCKSVVTNNQGTSTHERSVDSYGIQMTNSQNVSVIGGEYMGGNHGVSIGGADNKFGAISREILVKNVRAQCIRSGFVDAIDMHGNTEFITIEGCTTVGIYMRGRNNNVLNNFVYDSDISCDELENFNHNIKGNILKKATIAIVSSKLPTADDGNGNKVIVGDWVRDSVEETFVISGNKTWENPNIVSDGVTKRELRTFVTASTSRSSETDSTTGKIKYPGHTYYNESNTTIVIEDNDIRNGLNFVLDFEKVVMKDNIFSYDDDVAVKSSATPKLICGNLFVENNKFVGRGHDTVRTYRVKASMVYLKNNYVDTDNTIIGAPLFYANYSESSISKLYIEGNITNSMFFMTSYPVTEAYIRNNIFKQYCIRPSDDKAIMQGVNINPGENEPSIDYCVVTDNIVASAESNGVTTSIVTYASKIAYGRNIRLDTMVLTTPKIQSNTTGCVITNLDAGGGGGSEPAAYLKSASVSQDGNTLTLTNKDNTTVTFSPSATPVVITDGVYIEATDGTLVESTDWATAGKTANSILIVDGTWRRRIYIDDSYEMGACLASSWDVSGCTDDTDGSVNTATLRNLGSKPAIVAATFTVGGDTYLPAKQEMTDIFAYLTEINACRTALGKSALPTGNYWSSTYKSYDGSKYYLYIVNTDGTNTKGGGSSNAYYYIRVGKY